MDKLDFVIQVSGEFGTFFWELPENLKKLFLNLDIPEDAKQNVLCAFKDDIKSLIVPFLLSVSASFCYPPATPEMFAILVKHLQLAAREGKEILLQHKPF